MPLAPIEDALSDLRAGRMIVVCDDEDRENEATSRSPQRRSPRGDQLHAKHGRGLICLR